MKAGVASFRLWLLVAVVAAGVVGFAVARTAITRIEASQEEAADRAKDLQIAEAIAGQMAAGVDVQRLQAMQALLPNDQIIVNRHGERVFVGRPVIGSSVELEESATFPGGQVVLRDYHTPVAGSSLQVALVLGGCVLLVIAAAVAASWLLTNALEAPITRAAMAADRVAAGDLTARVGPARPEEFARLAHAFDSMAARLEAADRQQRQFLADVAHEIATPVNAISGLAVALADGTLITSEERADAASLLDTETRRIASLLDDLRQLTHLDIAERVRQEDVDMAEVCSSIQARFAATAAQAGVELSIEAPRASVRTDRRLLDMALDNLVSNAIRYTQTGGRVTIRSSRRGESHVLSVADTGIGIAAKDLERIFDRFFRVDTARDRAVGGSGLGLALARRAAQANAARIEVSSEPGQGSEFRLVIPL